MLYVLLKEIKHKTPSSLDGLPGADPPEGQEQSPAPKGSRLGVQGPRAGSQAPQSETPALPDSLEPGAGAGQFGALPAAKDSRAPRDAATRRP